MTTPQIVLFHHLGLLSMIVLGALLVGWLSLKYNERQRPAPPATVFNRTYAYLPDDVDRVAEAIYSTTVAGRFSEADMLNAAKAAYRQAEAFAAYKMARHR